MIENFKALVVRENNGKFEKTIENIGFADLPGDSVKIEVKYSGLNYKDALSASGNKGITKTYPHIPGIDAAGVVIESSSEKFHPGDEVIVTGYDMGMNHAGGFAQCICVPEEWIVAKPEGISLKDAMILGTSGFTAAIGVSNILEAGVTPDDGAVIVTGATGGVGSFVVKMLSKLGFSVEGSTGKEDEAEHLLALGASAVVNREELEDDKPEKGLLRGRWIAGFDTVGGKSLSFILKSIKPNGIVTNCGMIASTKLETSIMPFILRSVRLVGISSAPTAMPRRLAIWKKLAADFQIDLSGMYEEIDLEELPDKIDLMLAGKLSRKVLVNLQGK